MLKLRHGDEKKLDLRNSEGKWPGKNKQGQRSAEGLEKGRGECI